MCMNFVHSCVWQQFLKNKRWDEMMSDSTPDTSDPPEQCRSVSVPICLGSEVSRYLLMPSLLPCNFHSELTGTGGGSICMWCCKRYGQRGIPAPVYSHLIGLDWIELRFCECIEYLRKITILCVMFTFCCLFMIINNVNYALLITLSRV